MSQSKNKQQSIRRKKQQPWLLIVLLAGGLILVIVAIFALNNPTAFSLAQDGSGDPRLSVNKESVDLGNVKFNQTVEVVFKLTNEGGETLKFNQDPYVELLEGC